MRCLVLAVALAGCQREEAPDTRPQPDRPEATPAPRPSSTTPGRVVVLNVRADQRDRVRLVTTAGVSESVELAQGVAALPYDAGAMLLTQAADHEMRRVPVDGAALKQTERVGDLELVGVSDEGEAALLLGYDHGMRRPRVVLRDLRNGTTVSAPSKRLDRCKLHGTGDIAPNGSEAVFVCQPCNCISVSHDCPVDLCRLSRRPGESRVVATAGGFIGPRYAPDGRLVVGSTRLDDSAACSADVGSCRHDIVSVPAANPAATPLLVRRSAVPRSVSRTSGKILAEVREAEDYRRWYLAVVSPDGSTSPSLVGDGDRSQPTCAFSRDDEWVAVTSAVRMPDGPSRAGNRYRAVARACRTDGSQCIELGDGVATGWVVEAPAGAPAGSASLEGCFGVDAEAMAKTPISPDLKPARFGELVRGFGLHFESGTLTLWARTDPEGTHFVVTFP